MSDLVERLRKTAKLAVYGADREAAEDAAARIEQLEAALREIAKTTYGYEPFMTDEEAAEYFSSLFFGAQAKARAALEERT